MQNIMHRTSWDPDDLSYFTHLYSAILHDDSMDFFNHLVIVNSVQRWCSVPVNFIQRGFDLRSRPLL